MAVKYQIFVSSTYDDLKNEREQVIKAVLEMGHIPVGMEMFSAADDEQWKIITRQIDESDYYAVIVAHRYGSMDKDGKSYTEKEYDYAISKGIPVLGFVIDEEAHWRADFIESNHDKKISLEAFKHKVKNKPVNFWDNKNDLHGKFSISLMKAITANPQTGWLRASEAAGPELTKELIRLSSENSILRKELEQIKAAEDVKIGANEETFNILSKTKTSIHVWLKDAKSWGEPIEATLLGVFEAIAPNIMIENDLDGIASDLGFVYSRGKQRAEYPVPTNHLSHWIADLAALELVEPSSKKHSVHDNKEYWSLSLHGKEVQRSIRKLRLIQGIKTQEDEAPDIEES